MRQSKTKTEPEPVAIDLYEPIDPPAVPRKRIGRAKIGYDLWCQIGGVAHHYDSGKRGDFRLRGMAPLPEVPDFSAGAMAVTEMIPVVFAKVVRVWGPRGDTYSWVAVIPDEKDRELIASKKYKWVG